jgi:hypothetical protein
MDELTEVIPDHFDEIEILSLTRGDDSPPAAEVTMNDWLTIGLP